MNEIVGQAMHSSGRLHRSSLVAEQPESHDSYTKLSSQILHIPPHRTLITTIRFK